MRNDKIKSLTQCIESRLGIPLDHLLIIEDDLGVNFIINFPFRDDRIQVRMIISDTMHSFVELHFEGNVAVYNESVLRTTLSQINTKSSIVTFYHIPGIETGGICARVTYTTDDKNFDADFFIDCINNLIKVTDEFYYDDIMSLIEGE